MPITNDRLKDHPFLQEMYEDDFFPTHLVDKGRAILIRLCEEIEKEKPATNEAFLQLTHAATMEFNVLDQELQENASEIETEGREIIGADFQSIADAYGFKVDIEDVIAPREW